MDIFLVFAHQKQAGKWENLKFLELSQIPYPVRIHVEKVYILFHCGNISHREVHQQSEKEQEIVAARIRLFSGTNIPLIISGGIGALLRERIRWSMSPHK